MSHHEEVESENQERNQHSQSLPNPPIPDFMALMAQQTRLLMALAEGINQPRHQPQGLPNRMAEFVRIKPPTFAGSENPMEADDWMRNIQRKLRCNKLYGQR